MNAKNLKTCITIEQLIEFNNSVYFKEFEIKSFQRTFRKFFKFNILSENLFSIKSKISDKSIMVWVLDSNYFELRCTASQHLFLFNCTSSKELISKIIKHNLI